MLLKDKKNWDIIMAILNVELLSGMVNLRHAFDSLVLFEKKEIDCIKGEDVGEWRTGLAWGASYLPYIHNFLVTLCTNVRPIIRFTD